MAQQHARTALATSIAAARKEIEQILADLQALEQNAKDPTLRIHWGHVGDAAAILEGLQDVMKLDK